GRTPGPSGSSGAKPLLPTALQPLSRPKLGAPRSCCRWRYLSGTTTAARPRRFLRGARTVAPAWSETPPPRPSGRAPWVPAHAPDPCRSAARAQADSRYAPLQAGHRPHAAPPVAPETLATPP